MLILQYKESFTYDRLGRCFRVVYFTFMLVLLCLCVASVSRRVKIYIKYSKK